MDLSVTYLYAWPHPYSPIAVPYGPAAGPVAARNVHGRWTVVHYRRRTGRRYPKERTHCQSTKETRCEIVPRCRVLRREASERDGNRTARKRNLLHVAPPMCSRNICVKYQRNGPRLRLQNAALANFITHYGVWLTATGGDKQIKQIRW